MNTQKKQSPKKQHQKKRSKNLMPGLLFLSILLNLVLVYIIFEKKDVEIAQQKQINAEQQKQNKAQKASYQQSLDRLAHRLQQEITNSQKFGEEQQNYRDSLSKVLASVKQDRSNLQKVLILNQNQIKHYKLKIAAYEELLIRKDALMLTLKEIAERQRKKISSLDSVVTKTLGDKGIAEQKSRDLQKQIKEAGVLQPYDITIKRVNRRGRTKTGQSFRERNIAKILVCVRLMTNRLIEPGQKKVHMLLKDDLGQTLVPQIGGGEFKIKGEPVSFTAAQSFLFPRDNEPVVFAYDKDRPLGKGKFWVELYSNGEQIGKKHFQVR